MKKREPLILVIGGTYGVGKTMLAHQLSKELDIHHRAALGVVIKSLETFISNNAVVKNWGNYNNLQKSDIRRKLLREAELMGKVVHTFVDTAFRTRESYIIEGIQLLPQYLPLQKIYYCIIKVTDLNEHRKRVEQPTITRIKHLSNPTFQTARTIEEIILEEVERYGIPVFDNGSKISETSREIRNHFRI